MITPSHIIYGWAVAKATDPRPNTQRTTAFILGSLLPDVPIYTFFMIHTFILGTSQQVLWDDLYFASGWTPVFTLSHSLLLWPLVILIGSLLRQSVVRWVGIAGTIHVLLDFLVHKDDAYAHFWPISDWRFISPVSYWDPAHYGTTVGTLDSVVVLLLVYWLYRRDSVGWRQWVYLLVGLLYLALLVVPRFLFA